MRVVGGVGVCEGGGRTWLADCSSRLWSSTALARVDHERGVRGSACRPPTRNAGRGKQRRPPHANRRVPKAWGCVWTAPPHPVRRADRPRVCVCYVHAHKHTHARRHTNSQTQTQTNRHPGTRTHMRGRLNRACAARMPVHHRNVATYGRRAWTARAGADAGQG